MPGLLKTLESWARRAPQTCSPLWLWLAIPSFKEHSRRLGEAGRRRYSLESMPVYTIKCTRVLTLAGAWSSPSTQSLARCASGLWGRVWNCSGRALHRSCRAVDQPEGGSNTKCSETFFPTPFSNVKKIPSPTHPTPGCMDSNFWLKLSGRRVRRVRVCLSVCVACLRSARGLHGCRGCCRRDGARGA